MLLTLSAFPAIRVHKDILGHCSNCYINIVLTAILLPSSGVFSVVEI